MARTTTVIAGTTRDITNFFTDSSTGDPIDPDTVTAWAYEHDEDLSVELDVEPTGEGEYVASHEIPEGRCTLYLKGVGFDDSDRTEIVSVDYFGRPAREPEGS